MNDQAQRLRELITNARQERAKKSGNAESSVVEDARIITVTSGKGGVGKTNVTVNLALALQAMGKKVAVIDADLGLANVDLVLGMVTKYNLLHYLRQDMSVAQITMTGPMDLKVISGGSGLLELVNLSDEEIVKLVKLLSLLNESNDYILVDTGAGLNKSVLSFIEATKEVLLVVTPDPTSITDAYALIKNINPLEKDIKIVVNMAENDRESREVFNKLQIVADKFLGVQLNYLGAVRSDANVRSSIRAQEPFYLKVPQSSASLDIDKLAHLIAKIEVPKDKKNSFRGFLRRLFK